VIELFWSRHRAAIESDLRHVDSVSDGARSGSSGATTQLGATERCRLSGSQLRVIRRPAITIPNPAIATSPPAIAAGTPTSITANGAVGTFVRSPRIRPTTPPIAPAAAEPRSP